LGTMDRRFCEAGARTRLDRGSQSRDRIPLGRGTQQALRRDRGRDSSNSRSISLSRRGPRSSRQSRRQRPSRLSSPWRTTPLAPAWSRVSRGRAATSPPSAMRDHVYGNADNAATQGNAKVFQIGRRHQFANGFRGQCFSNAIIRNSLRPVTVGVTVATAAAKGEL
jgi:hypothetical protein